MPTDLLPPQNDEREEPDFEGGYDDKFMRGGKELPDDINDNSAASSRSLAEQEKSPWTTKVGKTDSGGSLAKQEKAAEDGSGFAYNPTDSSTSPIRQKFRGMVTKKRAAIGGSLVTGAILSIFGLSGLSGVELIHGRENMLKRGNALANSVLERRQGVSFGRMLRKMNRNDPLTTKLDIEKFKAQMAAEGFTAEFDGSRKLTSFTDTLTGRSYDFSLPAKRGAAALFAGNEGADMLKRLARVVPAETATWRGIGAGKVYKGMNTRLNNWLDRKPSDKAKNNQEKFSDLIRHADDTASPVERARAPDAPATDANGNPVGTQTDVSGTGETAALNKEFKDNPAANDSFIRNFGGETGVFNQSTVSTFGDQATQVIDSASTAAGNPAAADQIINQALPNLAKELPKKSIGIAARGLNALGYVSGGCRLRGTLNFIANARNVMVSVELARFAVKYLAAADHTKAHLVNAEAINLFMIYLHTPNPANGKSYSQAGGWENNVMGNKAAKPSATNNALFTMNRNQAGLLGSINRFVNGIPGINNASTCKFVNNGFVQAGGLAAGVVIAVFSGGTVTAGQVAGSIALQLLQEAAYQIATPLLVKAGAKMLINGSEKNGELSGDALGSGIGGLRAMNGNANGLRPITKQAAAVLQQQVDHELKRERGKESLFARYLDPYNGQSLFSNMAFAASSNVSFGSYRSLVSNNLVNPFSSISGLTSKFSSKAHAADPTCEDDPAIKKYNLEADIFCNPVVANAPDIDPDENEAVLLKNNQIDANGEPVAGSDYEQYIKDCHSGRPSILYTSNVSKDGNNEPIDAQCIEPGPAMAFDPSSSQGNTASMEGNSLVYQPPGDQPKPSLWTKLTGQKALAQAPASTPGKFQRFSAHLGTHQDIQNTICLINNDGFPDEVCSPIASAPPPANAAPTGQNLIDYANIGKNSDTIPCAPGTKLLGPVTLRYRGGLKQESGDLRINLCQVPDIPGQGNNPSGAEINGGITVNSRVSAAWQALATKAKADGAKLSATSSFRLADSCGGTGTGSLCATPGTSMHQLGIAVDFDMPHQKGGYSTKDCSNRNTMKGNAMWDWLDQNAPAFGIKQYSYENWHWDAFQSPSRCANGPGPSAGGAPAAPTTPAPGGSAPAGNVQQMAQQILANGNVTYPLDGRSPNGSSKAVLEALAQGRPAPVTCSNTSIRTAEVNPNILKFILESAQQTKVGINALTDKCHSSSSKHYRGEAIDLQRTVGSLSVFNSVAAKYNGRKNSETTHHHFDFPK